MKRLGEVAKVSQNNWYIEAIVAGCLVILVGLRFGSGQIQQDDYWSYASKLADGRITEIGYGESRLFPGLPLVLAGLARLGMDQVSSGWVTVIGLYFFSRAMLVKLGYKEQGWLVLWFPAVMAKQMSLVSSEALLIWWLLLASYLVKSKRYGAAGLVHGMAWWTRAIGGVPFVVLAGLLAGKKAYKELARTMMGFGVIFGSWWAYNHWILGTADLWWQFRVYQDIGRGQIALWQLAKDVWRAFDWGWYRHVWAAGGYLAILCLWIWMNLRNRKIQQIVDKYWWYGGLGMAGFVFSVGPTPFLEEFPRFLVPSFLFLNLLIFSRVKVPAVIAGLAVVTSMAVVVF